MEVSHFLSEIKTALPGKGVQFLCETNQNRQENPSKTPDVAISKRIASTAWIYKTQAIWGSPNPHPSHKQGSCA